MTLNYFGNIPRLERCDFNGICDKIGFFLSPQDFENFTLFRTNVIIDPQFDYFDTDPYSHLSDLEYDDYLFDRSIREL